MRGDSLKGDRPPHVGNGCYLYDNCFTCPFPDGCQLPNKYAAHNYELENEAKRLVSLGHSESDIAKEFGKPLKVIQRWIGSVGLPKKLI